MKPNGKRFAARAVFFALCAIGLMSGLGQAETAHGTFKLPVETRWGKMVLAPGEYEYNIASNGPINIITVRSVESGRSGIIMPASISDAPSASGAKLVLAKSADGTYVREFYLGDSGVKLNYSPPGEGKMVRLVKSHPITTASASGVH